MAYEKQPFVDGQTVVTAAILEHMEDGIADAGTAADAATEHVAALDELTAAHTKSLGAVTAQAAATESTVASLAPTVAAHTTSLQTATAEVSQLGTRMGAAESYIAADKTRLGVTYTQNSKPTIPNATDTIPEGWSLAGSGIAAISYSAAGWRINTAGVYIVGFSGAFYDVATTATLEYRLLLNGSRVAAMFGANGDYSSRSLTVVITASAGDVVAAEYYQKTGAALGLRPGSFNTISFAQIA